MVFDRTAKTDKSPSHRVNCRDLTIAISDSRKTWRVSRVDHEHRQLGSRLNVEACDESWSWPVILMDLDDVDDRYRPLV